MMYNISNKSLHLFSSDFRRFLLLFVPFRLLSRCYSEAFTSSRISVILFVEINLHSKVKDNIPCCDGLEFLINLESENDFVLFLFFSRIYNHNLN